MIRIWLLLSSVLPSLQTQCHSTIPAFSDAWCDFNYNHPVPNCPHDACSCSPPARKVAGMTWQIGISDCSTQQNGTIPAPLADDGIPVVAWSGPCGDIGRVTLSYVRHLGTQDIEAILFAVSQWQSSSRGPTRALWLQQSKLSTVPIKLVLLARLTLQSSIT